MKPEKVLEDLMAEILRRKLVAAQDLAEAETYGKSYHQDYCEGNFEAYESLWAFAEQLTRKGAV